MKWTKTQTAIAKGELLAAKEALALAVANGEDIHAPDEFGSNLFHTAVAYGNVELLDHLASLGLDVNLRDEDENMPIHTAAMHSNAAMITEIVRLGGEINAPDPQGNTPLHLATSHGRTDEALQLIALGANVNALNHNNENALQYGANNYAKLPVAHALIAAGIDVDNKNIFNMDAMQIANESNNAAVVQAIRSIASAAVKQVIDEAFDSATSSKPVKTKTSGMSL